MLGSKKRNWENSGQVTWWCYCQGYLTDKRFFWQRPRSYMVNGYDQHNATAMQVYTAATTAPFYRLQEAIWIPLTALRASQISTVASAGSRVNCSSFYIPILDSCSIPNPHLHRSSAPISSTEPQREVSCQETRQLQGWLTAHLQLISPRDSWRNRHH